MLSRLPGTAATRATRFGGRRSVVIYSAQNSMRFFSTSTNISKDEAAYILGTFRIVRRKDEAAQGEYRTMRVILKIYDAIAEAERTSIAYQTRLDPPPADPRAAHSPSTAGSAPVQR